MARPKRGNTSKGSTYHVSSEINRKAFELKKKKMKQLLLAVIEESKTKKEFQFKMHNFCILDNHIHFLITPAVGHSLSMIMKWIKQVFAIRWNREHGKRGHLWGDRFYSREIVDEEDFITVYNYIDQNPVMARVVMRAEDWPWGGLHHHQVGESRIVSAAPEWVVERLPGHRPRGQTLNPSPR